HQTCQNGTGCVLQAGLAHGRQKPDRGAEGSVICSPMLTRFGHRLCARFSRCRNQAILLRSNSSGFSSGAAPDFSGVAPATAVCAVAEVFSFVFASTSCSSCSSARCCRVVCGNLPGCVWLPTTALPGCLPGCVGFCASIAGSITDPQPGTMLPGWLAS